MNKYVIEEISVMKKYSSVLALFFLTFTLHAQSVWSGNASTGSASDFPGSSEVLRAASNSFPVGTLLKVTNPRGGAQVEVRVSGRLESPGVFILLEEEAASFIGLPKDQVLPVRVTPVSSAPVSEEPETAEADSNGKTKDPDYNPAVNLEESEAVSDAGAEKPEDVAVKDDEEPVKAEEETVKEVDNPIKPEDESDKVPEIILTYSLDAEEEEAGENPKAGYPDETAEPESGENLKVEEPAAEPAEPVAEPVVEPESGENLEAEEPAAEPAEPAEPVVEPESGENLKAEEPAPEPAEPVAEPLTEPEVGSREEGEKIYFLTPSDFRPPEAPVSPAPLVRETGKPAEKPVGADTESLMILPEAEKGALYVQVGAYSSRAVLEETSRRIQKIAPGYPLCVDSVQPGGKGVIYKLLVGPLTPAESGIVLRTARSSSFPDAFLYNL